MPTLKLIYDRDKEIKNFKPEPYYQLEATFSAPGGTYKGLLIEGNETKFKDFNKIEQIKKDIDMKNGIISSKRVEIKSQNAPRLFSMTDLMGYMSSKYNGWPSTKVKKVAQSLYEGKGEGSLISYPRTKSRALEETLVDKAKRVLDRLIGNLPYKDEIKFHTNKRVFNSEEVDGHSAIMPTLVEPKNLTTDEELLYNEIVKRFIAQFMPSAKYEHTEIISTVITDTGDRNFITKGKRLVEEGWLKIYGKEVNEDTEEELLPYVEENSSIKAINSKIHKKYTKAPPHYTEKSLLEAMEFCGRNLDKKYKDLSPEELSKILNGYEIGTSATRDEVIDKLLNVKYIERKGKSLCITDKGIRMVEIFPVKELLDVTYTGKLEKALSEIQKGNFTKQALLEHTNKLIKKGVEQIKNSNAVIVDNTNINSSMSDIEALGLCPNCQKPIIEGKKGYGCLGYKEGCKFVIWKENAFLKKFGINKIFFCLPL